MKIGYARVSTDDQTTALQLDALKRAGCTKTFKDHGVSGVAKDRPGLERALKALRKGDVLVVWRLDRLGRSLGDLIEIINALAARGCGFLSLTENIDTTTAGGRLVFHLMGALAEFERSLIGERTRAGLRAARARNVQLGRRPTLDARQVAHARKLVNAGERVEAVAASLGVNYTTLWRAFKRQEAQARIR